MLKYFIIFFMMYLFVVYIFLKYLKKFGYSKRLVFDDMVIMVYYSISKILNFVLNIIIKFKCFIKKNCSRFCLEFLLYVL